MLKKRKKWRVIARHRDWVSGATITESRPPEALMVDGVFITRFTATIDGIPGWRIYEGKAGDAVTRAVIEKVKELQQRYRAGDWLLLSEPKNYALSVPEI